MISSLKISLEDYNLVDNKETKTLSNLSKVNILVGANNSGKSRFMRSILSNELNYSPEGIDLKETSKKIIILKKDINNYFEKRGLVAQEIKKILDQIEDFSFINLRSKLFELIPSLEKTIEEMIRTKEKSWTNGIGYPEVGRDIKKIFERNIDVSFKEILKKLKPQEFRLIYIPMLRGLRSLIHKDPEQHRGISTPYISDSDCYWDRTVFDYFNQPNSEKPSPKTMNTYGIDFDENFHKKYNLEIFTGMYLYTEITNMLLGPPEGRMFITRFQDFLGKRFFQGQEITLIPRIKDDVLYIKIGDREERPIYDLGDGLQTVIIATFPLFKYQKENVLLFIEEPELTLHPGMQRKIIDTYCNEFSNSQVFITTHSNHLLDLTLDFENKTSVYSFEDNGSDGFNIKNVTPNKDILDLLGVRNSSVFLSNCIIWVEGVSDRLYIKKFLDLYKKSVSFPYEEDKHYSIVEYGGANITHFNFEDSKEDHTSTNVNSINKNNFLVADKDEVADYTTELDEILDDEKTKRLKRFYALLKNNFFAEHREIENLIPHTVFKEYFVRLASVPQRIWEYDSTIENEERFNLDIKDKPVGEVLKQRFIKLKENHTETESFKSKGIDCIGNKKNLAEKLTEVMNANLEFRDLSEIAQRLVQKIADFIKENNS